MIKVSMTSIENFLDKTELSTSSKNLYKATLDNLALNFDLNKLDTREKQKEVYDYIMQKTCGQKRKNDICFTLIKYIRYTKKQVFDDVFEGIFNTPAPVKIVKKLDRKKLIQILDSNTSLKNESRLLLNLLLKYDEVLRNDLASVKLQNYDDKKDNFYKDGKITFNYINKVEISKPIKIKLSKTDIELIENLSQEYLLTINSAFENRANNYTKLLKKLTSQVFGESITQTDFRHLAASDDFKKNENLPIKERFVTMNANAKKRGHSLVTALTKYVDE